MKNYIYGGVALGVIGLVIYGVAYYADNFKNPPDLTVSNTYNTKPMDHTGVQAQKQFVNMFGSTDATIPQTEPLLPDLNIKSTISVPEIEHMIETEKDARKVATMAYNLGMNYLGKLGDLQVQKDVDKAIQLFVRALDSGEINAGYELIQIYQDTHTPYYDQNKADFYTNKVNNISGNQ